MNILANPAYFVVDASARSVQRRADVGSDGGWVTDTQSLVTSDSVSCTGPLMFSCALFPPTGGVSPVMYFGLAGKFSDGTWIMLHRFQIDGSLSMVSNNVTTAYQPSLVNTDGDAYAITITAADGVRFVRNGQLVLTAPVVAGISQMRFQAYMRTKGVKLSDVTLVGALVPAANPVGLPEVKGTLTQSQTLTADTSGIGDLDGLGVFSYQWKSSATAGGTYAAIAGATAPTYVPTQGDVGMYIQVAVSYTSAIPVWDAVNMALMDGSSDTYYQPGTSNPSNWPGRLVSRQSFATSACATFKVTTASSSTYMSCGLTGVPIAASYDGTGGAHGTVAQSDYYVFTVDGPNVLAVRGSGTFGVALDTRAYVSGSTYSVAHDAASNTILYSVNGSPVCSYARTATAPLYGQVAVFKSFVGTLATVQATFRPTA